MNELSKGAMLGGSFTFLFAGFLALLYRIRWLEQLSRALKRTRDSMDETARRRLLESRKNLQDIHRKYSLWMRLEQELAYSGLRVRFPFLNAERFLVLSILLEAAVFLIVLLLGGPGRACIGMLLCLALEYIVLQTGKFRAMRSVNDNLIKFLDFLGSYSITAGEITGIFHQVSRYVEEPLQSALEECYYEAQTTGDTNLALLSMAEKIEHPKFKELAHNMEISIRYCADFTALVSNSRRSIREYHRMGDEKKGMLREAVINMLLLAAMSVLVLLIVDGLIGVSMWNVLHGTIPGRIAVGTLGMILLLFLRQIYRIHR